MGNEQSDTVPPPPGEEDAYSAETKVAPAPAELLKQIRDKQKAAPPRPAETTETELTPAIPNIAQLAKELSEDPENLQTVLIRVKPAEGDTKEPPLGGEPYDADSSEPTLDKNIRFFLKEQAERRGADAASTRASSDPGRVAPRAGQRVRRGQLLVAAVITLVTVVLIVWRFG